MLLFKSGVVGLMTKQFVPGKLITPPQRDPPKKKGYASGQHISLFQRENETSFQFLQIGFLGRIPFPEGSKNVSEAEKFAKAVRNVVRCVSFR